MLYFILRRERVDDEVNEGNSTAVYIIGLINSNIRFGILIDSPPKEMAHPLQWGELVYPHAVISSSVPHASVPAGKSRNNNKDKKRKKGGNISSLGICRAFSATRPPSSFINSKRPTWILYTFPGTFLKEKPHHLISWWYKDKSRHKANRWGHFSLLPPTSFCLFL